MTKNSTNRTIHYAMSSTPTPDEPDYQKFKDKYGQKITNDPKLQKQLRDDFKKAASIARTQSSNGIGFIQDIELRYFLQEFNSRVWEFGFGSMPAAFRVMEGFYNWVPKLFFFELFKEEEHLFSFFDFVDFITSDSCSNSIDYFKENVQDEIIYSYNILNEVDEISFKTSDSLEYVIGGVSLLKRGNEAYVLIIAGEKGDLTGKVNDDDYQQDYQNGKSYIKPAEDRKREAVKLFDKSNIWKVNLYLRIDLDTKTIDLRYIQKDAGDSFRTITDDIGMFLDSLKTLNLDAEFVSTTIKQKLEEINNYEAIFEIAYKCLHLPEYFDFNDAKISNEEHPTGLFNEKIRKSILSSDIPFNPDYFIKTRNVWVLDNNVLNGGKSFNLKKSELKIQKDGYWQQLEPGKIGRGKNGEAIHNRTWIEQTLTWYETVISNDVQVIIPEHISINSGYIYLLRNAAHDLDLFKIGLTTKTVEERAKQLSGTSSPDQFLTIHRWYVSDCFLAEKLIHEHLKDYRINNKREFFKVNLEEAISVISPIIKQINSASSKDNASKI